MSGTITIDTLKSGTNKQVSVDEIWHSSNDGSGSGLDADLLDGYDSSRYSRSAVATFGGGDWNTMDTHGTYKIHHDNFNSDTNPPPAAYPYGILVVDVGEIGGEARVLQIYYPHNSDYDRYFYQRMRNAGWWTAWAKIWRGGTGVGSNLEASRVVETAPLGEGRDLIYARMADNDLFRIRVWGTASNAGFVEIATADDGTEPIYVRQYTGVFANVTRTFTLLDANGNSTCPGTLTQNSDIRLKENIAPIPEALDKVTRLRGVTYDRIDQGMARQTGVIAQEVQDVLPEAVLQADDDQGTLSVAYGNMVGLLIEAIKELKSEVDALKAEVALLRGA